MTRRKPEPKAVPEDQVEAVEVEPEDGAGDADESARIAAAQAEREWTRMVANMSLGAYELFASVGDLPEPEWPTEPFRELFKIAFRGRLIDSRDHLVLKRLRGEV